MKRKVYAEYADAYYNRVVLGVKSGISFCIQVILIIAGAAIAVLFLPAVLSAVLNGGELDLTAVAALAVGIPALLIGAVRAVFWLAYPKVTVAVEPGKIILFPRTRREKVVARGDIIKVTQNDWWDFCSLYNSYSVTVLTRTGGYYKLKYVKGTTDVVAKLYKVRYDRAA
jgi:hypothetical protein